MIGTPPPFSLQLDLSATDLCGVDVAGGEGTYTAEGITALADALRVNGSLTSVRGFSLKCYPCAKA